MTSNENTSNVRIVLTPIKIVRDSNTGQWSTPRSRKEVVHKFKYDLRVRTPSTPVVSLSSPAAKKENSRTPRPTPRTIRQISFEKDPDEPVPTSSSDDDDDDEDEDDDDDDDDESSSSDEDDQLIADIRKPSTTPRATPATKRRRPTCLPRVRTTSVSQAIRR